MKDWRRIVELLRREESAALDMNTCAFAKCAEQFDNDQAMKDPHVLRTADMLNEVRRQFDLLPKQIAEDIQDPALRWQWARDLYWGYGCPKEAIAEHLLQCSIARVADLVGPSERSLTCIRCGQEFAPASQEEWRAAFLRGLELHGLENWGPVCGHCGLTA